MAWDGTTTKGLLVAIVYAATTEVVDCGGVVLKRGVVAPVSTRGRFGRCAASGDGLWL